jgi:ABC-type transport system involved in multi-copper enzyme maturation permease subunit
MSTATTTVPARSEPSVTPVRVTNSEWIKFRSLRSTWFSLGAALIVTIGLGVLITALRGADVVNHGGFDTGEDWTRLSLGGVLLAQLAVAVLGVLMITGEYSTGMIRASLSAVPRRNGVLLAKVAVLAGVTFVLGTVVSFMAFLSAQATIAGDHFGASLSSPTVLRAVIGGGLYLALVALLGLGLGFIFRNTGGALAALFGLLLILPLLIQAFPSGFRDAVSKFLPLNAGIEIMSTQSSSDALSPWAGIGVFALYVAVALGVGWVVLRRRDA